MYEKETLEIKNKYKEWLNKSNLGEMDLLEHESEKEFHVLSEMEKGFSIVMIGFLHDGIFDKLGESFVYKIGDTEAFLDLSILLFYIAQRLDEANKNRDRYFYSKIKEFVIREKKCNMINI